MKNIKIGNAVILIRLMAGCVFLSEGIQKFLYPDSLGPGRFLKIGLPMPDFLGNFVASFEVLCGLALIAGFYTRLAAVPLIIIMIVAIITTKIPIGINEGFWKMAHEARTDFSMLLANIFLLLTGGGAYSLDNKKKKNYDG